MYMITHRRDAEDTENTLAWNQHGNHIWLPALSMLSHWEFSWRRISSWKGRERHNHENTKVRKHEMKQRMAE